MSHHREFIEGLLAALISVLIVGGGLGISLAEDRMSLSEISSTTQPVSVGFEPPSSPIPNPIPPPLATEFTLEEELTGTSVAILQTTFTLTIFPSSTTCPYPSGWFPITIAIGDTLESIAQRYNTTPAELAKGNCLVRPAIRHGSKLYVPGPPPTEISVVCGPPPGWVFYTVQPGDNLFRIGLAFGVTVVDLQLANCLGNSDLIRAGQRLFVPNVSTMTPKVSATPTHTKRPRRTSTSTPRPTTTPTPTSTTVVIPSNTPSATPQPTPTPSATPRPSQTSTTTPVPSYTPSPTSTQTPTFTPTQMPTLTPTPSRTPIPTNTPTPTLEKATLIVTFTQVSAQVEGAVLNHPGYRR